MDTFADALASFFFFPIRNEQSLAVCPALSQASHVPLNDGRVELSQSASDNSPSVASRFCLFLSPHYNPWALARVVDSTQRLTEKSSRSTARVTAYVAVRSSVQPSQSEWPSLHEHSYQNALRSSLSWLSLVISSSTFPFLHVGERILVARGRQVPTDLAKHAQVS